MVSVSGNRALLFVPVAQFLIALVTIPAFRLFGLAGRTLALLRAILARRRFALAQILLLVRAAQTRRLYFLILLLLVTHKDFSLLIYDQPLVLELNIRQRLLKWRITICMPEPDVPFALA
jgi:hypothetical protein